MDTTSMSSPSKRRRLSACTTKGEGRRHRDRHLSVCTSQISKSSSRFDDLIDDLFIEILLRVPAKPLHRSKCVSKRWLSFISAPSFARSFILTARRHHHPDTNMLLFIVDSGLEGVAQPYALPLLPGTWDEVSSIPLTFDFISPLRLDNSDQFSVDEVRRRLLFNVHILGTYGGLVLLSGYFHFQDTCPEDDQSYHCNYYYVCNPVSKHWVELPLISPFNIVGFTCYHVQQVEGQSEGCRIWVDTTSYEEIIRNNANFDPNKIEFTVVSINRDEEKDEFIIHVFSSTNEAAKWSIFHVPFPPGCSPMYIEPGAKVLFVNGKFHWCGINCIVAYDPFNNPLHCDIIPLPPTDPLELENNIRLMLLEICEGHLRLVKLTLTGRFVVWDLVDYDNKAWVQTFDVDYDYFHLFFQSFPFVGAKDKVYMTYDSSVMLFDVKNKSLQLVYNPINLEHLNGKLRFVQPFLSSPWPTPVALRQQRSIQRA